MIVAKSRLGHIQMLTFCCLIAFNVGCSKADHKSESLTNYEMDTETYAGHILFVNVQDLQEIRKLALSQEDKVPGWISNSKFDGFDGINWSICGYEDIRGGQSISQCVLDYFILYKMNSEHLGKSFNEIPKDDWLVGAFDKESGDYLIGVSVEGKVITAH